MINENEKSKLFLIAEAGVNHNGNLNKALKMVRLAKKAGADCVKFQAFSLNRLVTKKAKSAHYQKKSTGNDLQFDILKKLQLKKPEFKKIFKECRRLGIEFLCTAFDEKWLDFLVDIGMNKIKIPSGEITNIPYLRYASTFNLKIILSTGMSNMQEITKAIKTIKHVNEKAEISLLHCTSLYPAPYNTLNLRAISSMKDKFRMDVGYSDHSLGNIASISAVTLGAKIIEKHFTLNKNLKGPDHQASANYKELKNLFTDLRNLKISLGDGKKTPHFKEFDTANAARKSWHAKKKILKDNQLKKDDVYLIRPGFGIAGSVDIIGKKTKVEIKKNEMIKEEWLI